MRSRRARRHEPVGKAASHQEDGSHAIIAARRKWAMPRRAISLTARCRRSSFHLDAISEVPHASAGHRSSKHERLTPLSRRFSWQLHCERDDPIRTMLPCQHLAFLGALRKSWSTSSATAKPPCAAGLFCGANQNELAVRSEHEMVRLLRALPFRPEWSPVQVVMAKRRRASWDIRQIV